MSPLGLVGLPRLGELGQLSGRCRGAGIAVHRGRVLAHSSPYWASAAGVAGVL